MQLKDSFLLSIKLNRQKLDPTRIVTVDFSENVTIDRQTLIARFFLDFMYIEKLEQLHEIDYLIIQSM